MLMANSAAIITDAFPADQRGMALGINIVAGIAGSFIGLVARRAAGRVELARRSSGSTCRSASLGTVWAYQSLHDTGVRRHGADRLVGQRHLRGRPDRAAGRDHLRHPAVRRAHHGLDQPVGAGRPDRRRRAAGRCSCVIETRVAEPMFPLRLFRIPAFASGNAASLLGAIARGGLQFMLIIWLQGIWLPLHGYDYARHPAVGRHLPAAADGRLPGRRAGRRAPVRPVRRPAVRGRRPAGHGAVVRRAAADPDRLQLPGLRRAGLPQRRSAAACSPRRTPRWSCRACRRTCAARPPACGPPSMNAGMVLSIGVFFSLMVAGLADVAAARRWTAG